MLMFMQPNGLPPTPPPYNPNTVERNPYDFLNEPPAAKRGLLSGTTSKKQRTLVVVGGGLAILALITIILSVVFGGAPSNKEELLSLAQQQNELIRVADIGVSKARDAEAKDLAVSSKLTFISDQQPLLTALKAQKVKVSTKQLAATKNTKTDQQLTEAEQANNFDTVFIEILQSELSTYQKALKKAYDNPATGQKLKATLATQYKNASLIINAKPEL